MKLPTILITLLLFIPCLQVEGNDTIVAIYHSQLKNNTYFATRTHHEHLLETANIDTLMAEYSRHGMGATHMDSCSGGLTPISLIEYLTHIRHNISYEEQFIYMDHLYSKMRRYNNKRLELAIDLMKGYFWSDVEHYDIKMEWWDNLLRKARKYGDTDIEAYTLRCIWSTNYHNAHFARTFAYATRWEEVLEHVTGSYPHKAEDYFNLGMSYYRFKDYDRAIPLMHKAIRVGGYSLRPWNYLATYHQMNGRLDSAAYYHCAILTSHEAMTEDPINLAIAISNLGRIEMQQGNYTVARTMLEAGLDYVKGRWDIGFTTGVRISLGECYLEQGYMDAALQQINDARQSVHEMGGGSPLQYRLKYLYALQSRYYARQGRHDLEKAFQDSALTASTLYEQLSGRHVILLGEQQLQQAEAQLQAEQIARQKTVILYAAAALVIITGALLIIIRLYRKRDAAYRVLAQKAKEWADSEALHPSLQANGVVTRMDASPEPSSTLPPTEEDLRIMALAENEMTEKHLYREAGLTIDSFACQLGIRRNVFSHAINKVTGGNFNQYINSYRIKEAVRIISSTERSKLYIEELYEGVGFSNRISFYRAFKQFTGLSPLEFQKKKNSKYLDD